MWIAEIINNFGVFIIPLIVGAYVLWKIITHYTGTEPIPV